MFAMMDDQDCVQEQKFVSNCRLFLSNVRRRRRPHPRTFEKDGNDGWCSLLPDDNNSKLDYDKSKLKQDLKDWFQQYGDVVEVFLPDRVVPAATTNRKNGNNKQKMKKQLLYAFVTMATPESAQLAITDNSKKNSKNDGYNNEVEEFDSNISITNLHNNNNNNSEDQLRINKNICPLLFDDCMPAPAIRNKRQQKKMKSENQNQIHIQNLLQSSNIICQLSESHLQRFEEYVLPYSEQQQQSTMEEEVYVYSNSVATTPSSSLSSQVHGDVIGWIKTDSKTMVLVFLYSAKPKQFLSECILKDWFVRPIIHRTMIIQRSQIFPLTCPPLEEERSNSSNDSASILGKLLDGIKLGIYKAIEDHINSAATVTSTATTGAASPLRVRLQLFPPRLLQPLLGRLQQNSYHANDRQWEAFNNNNNAEFTPTNNATHTLTIIRISETAFAMGCLERNIVGNGNNPVAIPNEYEKRREGKNGHVHLENGNFINNKGEKKKKKDGNYTAICRAHWKLQEAFERYRYELPSNPQTALDCGSAPGGWTRCLGDIYSNSCRRIYSVDPGEMDDSVLQLPTVQHIPMTIQNAFLWLSEQQEQQRQQQQNCTDRSNLWFQEYDISNTNANNSNAHTSTKNQNNDPTFPDCHCPCTMDVWVSDMCVKDMEQQVTLFLEARELGIVGNGTFFVLTLKCIVGYSAATFELLCQKQVQDRLQPVSRNLHQLHLFTNRISERTVMGYLT